MNIETTPMSPKAIKEFKMKQVPGFLVEIINRILLKKWDGISVYIEFFYLKKEVEESLAFKESKQKWCHPEWFEFEDLFQAEGWKVERRYYPPLDSKQEQFVMGWTFTEL